MAELESRRQVTPPPAFSALPDNLPPELGFLQDRFADRDSLLKVTRLARVWGVSTDRVLFSMNLVRPDDYYRALALHAGLDFTDLIHHAPNWSVYRQVHKRAIEMGDIAPIGQNEDGLQIAVAPSGASVRRIALLADQPYLSYRLRGQILITTPGRIRRAFLERFRSTISRQALRGLEEKYPDSSARSGLSIWQKTACFCLLLIAVIGSWFAPAAIWVGLNVLLAAIFMAVTLFRAGAVFWSALHRADDGAAPETLPDSDLPVYTILVPLFREARVLPPLVEALMRLDYPIAKLDIKLIFEEEDTATRQAADNLNLPAAFDIIVVPPIGPQTKPKALNFALQFARGDFAVIYDAEDRPDRISLKRLLSPSVMARRTWCACRPNCRFTIIGITG
ncbi:MAG: glycosyltransferase [Fimbriimonadaceae bacterium]|nr:glycosyltransferase [Alphaproteobacteria bacterium]